MSKGPHVVRNLPNPKDTRLAEEIHHPGAVSKAAPKPSLRLSCT
jgi:hypothetical protein